ncbi:MAG: VCBS repeat-containing protein, partial [candidate division WOR-3 bacterium]
MYKITKTTIFLILIFASLLTAATWNYQSIWTGTGILRRVAIGNKIKGPTDDTFRILTVQSSGTKLVLLFTDTSSTLPMMWRVDTVDTGAFFGCGIGDVDRDGDNDLVYARATSPYYVARSYWDPSTSTWLHENIVTLAGTAPNWGMDIGDANNDGYADDIIYSAGNTTNSKVYWAFWDGHAWINTVIWNGDGRTTMGVAIGNFDSANGDSNEVVAVTNGTSGGPGGRVMRLCLTPSGWDTLTLWMQGTTTGTLSLSGVAIGDFDSHNSGKEIVTTNATTTSGSINGSVFEVYGSGTNWSSRTLYSADISYWAVAVGDVLNTNPGEEIVFSDNASSGIVHILWGAGDEWYNEPIFNMGGGSSFGAAIGDVNRHRSFNQ